ncbi:MAG: methylated-DNA--[protein]-cysteine S-methyltransferase [Oscillospiraceae bacterium]|jgi:methylated-DNA-[protein]-cysteine S-methyltransferase|nr:methylated-DNA--[protein]-cysteine S-methyltransferase [Oscillospiraceae bacterium]
MFYFTTHPSPIGSLTLACDGDSLIGLWIDGQKYHGCAIFKAMTERADIPVFDAVKEWLARYFAGKKPGISEAPLSPVGSEFRQSVWRALCEIPYGAVTTYGDIAREIAGGMNRKSMSGQAIGGAVGHNPVSIIIPCHRVVGANGSLTGYAGGIAVKRKLLELEGVDMSGLFTPTKGSAL